MPSHADQRDPDSPFRSPQPVQLGFSTLMIMLLMVVGAGIGLLGYYALRVPSITAEWNAWFGRPTSPNSRTDGRAEQVTFALFVYTAPLALGILVSFLHSAINWLDRRRKERASDEDDLFRMGPS